MILKRGFKVLGWMAACFGLMGLMLGCGSVLKEEKKESSSSMTVSQPQAAKKLDRPDAKYYDFDDIQIPKELKQDTKKTQVFQSPNLIAGVEVFDGYVDVKSLNDFFKDAMAHDNWQIKGNFKLSPNTVLLFEKKNKRSIFIIKEGMFKTQVEIWMLPTQDGR
jgi:hypothetical protein